MKKKVPCTPVVIMKVCFLQQKSSRPTAVMSSAAAMATEDLGNDFEPWSSKRSGILSKYTTSEKLSITTSFLASDKEKCKDVLKNKSVRMYYSGV